MGYRLIDTAQAYFNEEAFGNAIEKCGVSREVTIFDAAYRYFLTFKHLLDKHNVGVETLKKRKQKSRPCGYGFCKPNAPCSGASGNR